MKLRSPETMRALMNQYNMSLGLLADYASCSKGFISHLLSGRRSSCTPILAERIARSLHVPVEVLFEPKMSTSSTPVDKNKVVA
jgi:antitoxin component HigA of HigAB toxin-antitoxin module